jgi:hypothetical protein
LPCSIQKPGTDYPAGAIGVPLEGTAEGRVVVDGTILDSPLPEATTEKRRKGEEGHGGDDWKGLRDFRRDENASMLSG